MAVGVTLDSMALGRGDMSASKTRSILCESIGSYSVHLLVESVSLKRLIVIVLLATAAQLVEVGRSQFRMLAAMGNSFPRLLLHAGLWTCCRRSVYLQAPSMMF